MDNVNISNLDLNLLRTFVVLMEERNVSSASKRLNLSQSATSNALERIRESFNDRVLEREGRTMVPTRAAQELWPKLSTALADIESAIGTSAELKPETMQSHFTIGIDEYVMALHGAALINTINQEAAGVSLAFTIARPGNYTSQLVHNDVDLIIAPVWQSEPDIVQHHLFDEDFVGLMANDHPLAGKKMTKKRYVSYPHILISSRGIVEGNVDSGLQQANLSRQVKISTPWFESAPKYLANTHYLLNMGRQLSEKLAATHPVHTFTLPVPVPGFSVFMLWHPRHTTDRHLAWLRELCSAILTDQA